MPVLLLTALRTTARQLARLRGLGATPADILRCAVNTLKPQPSPDPLPGVGLLTFSVVPRLTELWLSATVPRLAHLIAQTTVGDCSGALRRTLLAQTVIVPYLNVHHGRKLDSFLAHRCCHDYVLICDDDVFPTEAALLWAIEQLASDPSTIAASLDPRQTLSSLMTGRVEQAMGSSCLLVNRRLWINSGLSFRARPPDPGEPTDWGYDTGDYAQLRAQALGYRIAILPPALHRDMPALEAMSGWLLRFAEHSPARLRETLQAPSVRLTKAWRVLLAAELIAELTGVFLLSPELLHDARVVLEEHSPSQGEATLRREMLATCRSIVHMMGRSPSVAPEPRIGPLAS